MKKVFTGVIMAVFFVLCTGLEVHAVNLADAKALVEKAYSYMKTNGKDKAIAEFNNPKGRFANTDLCLFVEDFDGNMLAHSHNPKLVGRNHLTLRDSNDKPFVKEMIEVAKTKGSGTVEYSWTNPVTKKIQPQVSYIKKVDAENLYIGCGFFK